jgi:biopolymer transport protein ExbD
VRRFSQRNFLVTLSEINITPLLDLAFVLLIIFIITRPMMEGHVNIQLPESSTSQAKTIDRRNVHLVEVEAGGTYRLNGRRLALSQVETELVRASHDNPKLIVDIRADKHVEFNYYFRLTDVCLRNHISNFIIHTAPEGKP